MKICITSRAPFIAGAEIAGERLAVGLQEAGHEVLMVVGTRGAAFDRFTDAGIRCHFIPQCYTGGLGIKYRRHRNALRKLLQAERPDIVHSNDLPTHQMTSDAARHLRIPRICHHRWIFDGEGTDWFNKFGAEQHVFVSSAAMNELVKPSVSLKKQPCDVLYDGLPIPKLPDLNIRDACRAKLGYADNQTSVLFAGQVVERKGVADILHAWTQLELQDEQKTVLTIVGDDLDGNGSYRIEMEQLARDLNIDARFEGFQKNVKEWITAADIVLVPSHQEPLGNATLEAMAMAKPVIGSTAGGIPEMIDHEKTGLLVPPKDPTPLSEAITRLVNSPAEREAFGVRARQKCESQFSLETHIQNTLDVYQSLLDKNASRN